MQLVYYVYVYVCVCVGGRSVWHGAGQHSAALLGHHGDHPYQEGGLSNQTALSQLPKKVGHLLIFTLRTSVSSNWTMWAKIWCKLSQSPVQLPFLKRIVSVPFTTHNLQFVKIELLSFSGESTIHTPVSSCWNNHLALANQVKAAETNWSHSTSDHWLPKYCGL